MAKQLTWESPDACDHMNQALISRFQGPFQQPRQENSVQHFMQNEYKLPTFQPGTKVPLRMFEEEKKFRNKSTWYL